MKLTFALLIAAVGAVRISHKANHTSPNPYIKIRSLAQLKLKAKDDEMAKAVFDAFDTDGDGAITESEVKTVAPVFCAALMEELEIEA